MGCCCAKITLFIQPETGGVIPVLSVPANISIGSLKEYLVREKIIQLPNFCLTWLGFMLWGDATPISDFGVKSGAVLGVVEVPRICVWSRPPKMQRSSSIELH